MPLVPAKCTNCGAELKINSDNDACVCEFCHTPFVVQKAINNYNTYNKNIYNIQNANLNIENENSIERRLENADIFFNKIHNIEKAKELYRSVTEDAPGDYRGWWGLIKIETDNFTKIVKVIPNNVYYYYQNAIAVCDENQKYSLINQWEDYSNQCKRYNTKCEYEANMNAKLNDTNWRLSRLRNERDVAIKWLIISSIMLTLYFAILTGENEVTKDIMVFILLIPALILVLVFTATLINSCKKIKKVLIELSEIKLKTK